MSHRNTDRYEFWAKVSRVVTCLVLVTAICFVGAGFVKGLHMPRPELLTAEVYMQRVTSAVEQSDTPYMREHAYWAGVCSVTDELNQVVDSRRADVYEEFKSRATLYYFDLLWQGRLPYQNLQEWAEKGKAEQDCASLQR